MYDIHDMLHSCICVYPFSLLLSFSLSLFSSPSAYWVFRYLNWSGCVCVRAHTHVCMCIFINVSHMHTLIH